MRRYKVSIVGAGMVGSTAAQCIVQKDLADVVLVDIREEVAKGKALDIWEASPLNGFQGTIQGTADYALTKDTDVAVITAGIPRKPGMTREELLGINGKIVVNVVRDIIEYSPEAIIIVVTNPVDVLTYAAKKIVDLPRTQIIGMAGMLDSSRLRSFIALELNVSPQDVTAMVIGAHTEKYMMPLLRLANVNGVPVTELLDEDTLQRLAERTKMAGAEIVSLLKTGSAYYAPAMAISEMVEAILRDEKSIMPCSVCLEGEYGLTDCALCVPTVLGKEGMEKIIEIELQPEEITQMKEGAAAIKEMIGCMKI
ncbi:MAG: malate dehydrogenase [Thermovirga sp.]|nr:malate dehydrogenase [Thermovirga sp.]MDL1969506.1 malate dehydrogenase [Candidatus Desulfofervidaceae bacterium]